MPAENDQNTFRRQAAARSKGSLAQFLSFVLHNKKWWLTPIIIVLLLIGFLVLLGGTGVAPLIYTLF